ncbi:hypothetical protein GQ53DRAFT_595648, partial [Thozetella sp. PMI_491]
KKKPHQAKNAEEYWQLKYEECRLGTVDPQSLVDKARKRNIKGRQSKQAVEDKSDNLIQLLREGDPITARAAVRHERLAGGRVGKNRAEQMRQLVQNIAQNPGADKRHAAKYDRKLLLEATKSFGLRKCRYVKLNGRWMLPGMESSLYNHQLVGVRWMLGQEFSPEGPFGGIQADQMGLGKTLQMLATITNNPPSAETKLNGHGATLIVAPATTIQQWMTEIFKHTHPKLSVIRYQASSMKGFPVESWCHHDIVVTSYQEVANAHPSEEKLKRCASMKLNNENWAGEFDRALGQLFRVKFHRVVLDEAHAIKNYRSRTSRACSALSSKYRWALSGTPIQNSIDELYPYMRFIPRFRDNISLHIKEGTAKKKIRTYLAYLTRIRQAVAHPFLMERPLRCDFTLEDLQWLRAQLQIHGGKVPACEQLQRWIEIEYNESQAGNGAMSFGVGGHGYYFDMNRQLEKIHRTKTLDEVVCRRCYDEPDNPHITECGHTFCVDCLEKLSETASKTKTPLKCTACGAVLTNIALLEQIGGDLAGVNDDDAEQTNNRRSGKKRKHKPADVAEVGDDHHWTQPVSRPPSKWLDQWDKEQKVPLTPGAKTVAVKNRILAWQREAPDDKIIIFTQWVLLARIIGRILAEEHITFLYYFGNMSKDQRNAAVKAFHDNPEIKVLIASTKCGGQALNLTCANRVILTDLWWNTAVERQAFGRVHRIGQKKETYFCKIVCRNTIDERLVDMQDEKDRFIARTLNDGMTNTKKSFTLKDIQRLFQDSENPDDILEGEGDENNVE